MIGNPYYSQWGIKSQGEDITNDIIGMVQSANSFIVIGGYNFSFANAGQTFFNELVHKANNGVPVLMIFPPNLYGPNNPQPTIISHCIRNNIGVILSYQNHSKWLLSEQSLYYGSSNFSPTSWSQKIEVVTMHNHRRIGYQWANDTVNDFRRFIQREINAMTRRPTMNNYPGLVAQTQNTWNQMTNLILRFNPSIEKVKITLENYTTVELELLELTQEWFYNAKPNDFSSIFKLNSGILSSINQLCEYAYANIYNESTDATSIENKEIIGSYNKLHDSFINTVDESKGFLENLLDVKFDDQTNDLRIKNIEIQKAVQEKINTAPNNS